MSRAVLVRLHGRVQGVGYRAWTEVQARALGLAGFVRNRADGTVEALFAGPDEAVEAMLGKCRIGPPAAQVTGLDVTSADASEAPSPFVSRPTC